MQIHARNVKISQDGQNVKMFTLDLNKSNFEFDLDIKLPYFP